MQQYRYAFQGQELDPETGMEAFQLRLWDGRIGRWLTTDPYGQYASPYLGMGNNPVGMIDHDGGKSFWHRDSGGNLIADAGDDAFTLANYLNISLDQAFMTFSQNFRNTTATLSGGELFNNVPFVSTVTWLENVNVSRNKLNFDKDLAFNLIGTTGDAGEGLVYGRKYFQDNLFLDYNKMFKGIGLAGNAYDVANGSYVLYNSNTKEELVSNGISLGVDAVMIKVGQKHPLAAAIYGVVKIVGSSDMYLREQEIAKQNEWHKKHGYPINDAIAKPMFRQDSGMYRNCPTCPLKFK